MNNTGMREYAQDFAERLQQECGTDVARQVDRAWRLSYSRPPTADDLKAAVGFVTAQTAHYYEHPAKLERVTGPAEKDNAAPDLLGLTALCHALVSANEFLYVD